jgi:hypothetical protein
MRDVFLQHQFIRCPGHYDRLFAALAAALQEGKKVSKAA